MKKVDYKLTGIQFLYPGRNRNLDVTLSLAKGDQ